MQGAKCERKGGRGRYMEESLEETIPTFYKPSFSGEERDEAINRAMLLEKEMDDVRARLDEGEASTPAGSHCLVGCAIHRGTLI